MTTEHQEGKATWENLSLSASLCAVTRAWSKAIAPCEPLPPDSQPCSSLLSVVPPMVCSASLVSEGKWASDSISPPCPGLTKHSFLCFQRCFLCPGFCFPHPGLPQPQVCPFLTLQLTFKLDGSPVSQRRKQPYSGELRGAGIQGQAG